MSGRPGISGDGVAQGGEYVVAVFAHGGDIAADAQPCGGAGGGAVAAGDLELGFDWAQPRFEPLLVNGTARSTVKGSTSSSRSLRRSRRLRADRGTFPRTGTRSTGPAPRRRYGGCGSASSRRRGRASTARCAACNG
jgi:hypothetical protein